MFDHRSQTPLEQKVNTNFLESFYRLRRADPAWGPAGVKIWREVENVIVMAARVESNQQCVLKLAKTPEGLQRAWLAIANIEEYVKAAKRVAFPGFTLSSWLTYVTDDTTRPTMLGWTPLSQRVHPFVYSEGNQLTGPHGKERLYLCQHLLDIYLMYADTLEVYFFRDV